MKIVQINTVTGTGSIGKIMVGIYKVAERNGDEPIIYYGRRKAPDGLHATKIASHAGVAFHVLRGLFLGNSGFGSNYDTKRLIRMLEAEKPDVIHLHNIHGFYLNIEILFRYLKNSEIPIVWTLHDCWPFTGHCAYFDYVGCNKWKKECYQCVQKRTAYPYSLIFDRSRENYNRKKELFTGLKNLYIVTPSHWLQELVQTSFLSEYPVRVIPNGIDLNQFKPMDTDQEEKIILGVANIWEQRKGLIYFEQLSNYLKENEIIYLVGVNKKQQMELQKKERKGLLPSGKIKTICRTENQQQLAQLYAKAYVYVNTTLEDNFPTTNLEALACGTPVITFDTGGSSESLDYSCGIVVPQKDVAALYRAIRTIKPDAKACRRRAQMFSLQDRFGDYLSLYRAVAKKNNNEIKDIR